MRFPPQFLDELRARLPVSEVVGKRVRLRKAGREWKGLSPFNKERTPSFTVNDQKGFYHDFSSGKHGDIFAFVMETEGVGFAEAVERLASLAGVAVPKLTPEAEAQESRRHTLHEVCEQAAAFFEAALAGRAGAKARGYLADRGLDSPTQVKFRIGYAPSERFALKEHLGNLGISVEDMIEAGLLVHGDDIPVPYDRFRNRVMFPIGDLAGRIVAFGGRALDKDAPAKYLNSPETPLFHKGATLYNGAAARQAAHRGAPVIAVEGYVDVIAMVTAGYPATVAPLGTALTGDQLALLWKMADEPILCFDGDAAGRRAAYRAIDLALPQIKPGKSLSFAALPDGHDPDDLVRSGGAGAIADVLAGARPLGEVLWTRETESARIDTPERRAGLEARINELTNRIADEAVRRYYRQDLRERLRNLVAPPPAPGRLAPDRRGPQFGRGERRDGGRGRDGGRDGREAALGWISSRPARPGQRPPAGEFDRARLAHRAAAARGSDPHRRLQPSLAHRKPCGGTRRARIPQWRCRPAAPRHAGSRRRPRPPHAAGAARGVAGARLRACSRPDRGRGYPFRRLAGPGGRGKRRYPPVVDPRSHLASQEPHAK